MKLSKLTKPELEEIYRNSNFTEEEEKNILDACRRKKFRADICKNFSSNSNRKQKSKKYKR